MNGYFVPRHGGGRLRPWKPGQSGNPGGLSGRYGAVVHLAREVSPEIMRQLIEIATDSGEETRARIVAMTAILDRAFGKVKEARPGDGVPTITIDSETVSDAQLERLEAAAREMRRAQGDAREVGDDD